MLNRPDLQKNGNARGRTAALNPGDWLVIAGKGHEDYQIVGKTKHHFDDREEAVKAMEKC